MNILLVSPLPPPSGGMSTWTCGYLDEAKAQGHHVCVVNTALIGDRASHTKKKMHLINELQRACGVIKAQWTYMKQGQFDVMHLNTNCAVFGMLRDYLCVLFARNRFPIILQCHCNVGDWIGEKKIARILFGMLLKKTKRVVVLNKRSSDFIARVYGISSIIIPNFIKDEGKQSEYSVRSELMNVAYVGHVKVKKGIRELIEVAKKETDIQFQVYGPVQQEVLDIQAPPNVHFHGETAHDDIMNALRQSDVFLFPSYSEGFSLSLLEAMQVGLPCIATDVGANDDMVGSDGGVIVEVGDVNALRQGLNRMRTADVRRKMSLRNRMKVRNEYSVNSVFRKLEQVYDEVRLHI